MTVQITHTRAEAGWRLEWIDTDVLIFDSDRFDAEVIVERTGCLTFDRWELATLLGISDKTIWDWVGRGRIPQPHHYEPGKARSRAIWTRRQIVDLVTERLKRELVSA